MTQQQQSDDGPPQAKRIKIDPTVLRDFVAQQIKQLLGEEEATLIDFILNHVSADKPLAALQEELKPVLEEDTGLFLDALKAKLQDTNK
jgi:inosine/xanthosine triphosphate pyrophosphatase family protein